MKAQLTYRKRARGARRARLNWSNGGVISRKRGTLALVVLGGLAVAVAGVGVTAAAPGAKRQGGPEVWVAAQDASKVLVVRGTRQVATIDLPEGTSPHFTRFSPSGRYVYVPGLGFGDVTVIRARDRQVVARVPLAAATPPAVNSNPKLPGGLGTHDAAPSPDGSTVLAAQWSNNTLYKLAANEAAERWSVAQQATLPRRPICIVYHPDGRRAYVGTVPNGILVVDVASLTVLKALPTTGAWSCAWAQTRDGRTMYASTNAAPGFVYRIDMLDDTITDLGLALTSQHIHGLGLSANEKTLYLTSREDDSLRLVALDRGNEVTSMPLDATIGVPDRPDMVAVKGDNIWISLRSSGKLALLRGTRVEYVPLQPACPASEPLCYAIHSVEVRPDRDAPASRIASPRAGRHLSANGFRAVHGTASDELSDVASVQVALRQRTGARCSWWSGSRLVRRGCTSPLWIAAAGRERWSYRLTRTLPPGAYELRSRATDSEHNREAVFARRRNSVSFRLR